MKFYTHLLLLTLTINFIVGCNSTQDTNKTSVDTDKEITEILNPYKTVAADEICEVMVPKYFTEMNDINPKAIIQYGYVEEEDTINPNYIEDEIYMIVLVDYKYEIQKVYGDTIEVGIEFFNQICHADLASILEDFSAEHQHPKVQVENGVKHIHNEFLGRIDEYLVYYQIGIFETETGFYQVLTWTMQEYMNKHKDEMLKMTTSFKEL